MRERDWFTDGEEDILRGQLTAMRQLIESGSLDILTKHMATDYPMTYGEEFRQLVGDMLMVAYPRIYTNMRDPKTRFRVTTLNTVSP